MARNGAADLNNTHSPLTTDWKNNVAFAAAYCAAETPYILASCSVIVEISNNVLPIFFFMALFPHSVAVPKFLRAELKAI